MSANTVQPDPNRYDPALGDPLAPTPTSGNDEVEEMCAELNGAAHCLRQEDFLVFGTKVLEAAALLRKQAARIAELQKDAK